MIKLNFIVSVKYLFLIDLDLGIIFSFRVSHHWLPGA